MGLEGKGRGQNDMFILRSVDSNLCFWVFMGGVCLR